MPPLTLQFDRVHVAPKKAIEKREYAKAKQLSELLTHIHVKSMTEDKGKYA